MSTIRGRQGVTKNFEEITFSPQGGWVTRGSLEGPKESVRAALQELADQGYTFTYTSDQNPKASVRHEIQGLDGDSPDTTETPSLVWEYLGNAVEIDLMEADISSINGISDVIKQEIRESIQNWNPDEVFDSGDDTANALQSLMVNGVRSFRFYIPTLKVSKLVSGGYPVKASLTNVGRLISTATLTIQESIPDTILFNLPTYTTSKTGFVYAWYKKHPNVQQSGGNKWNVSQEWEYGLWPTLLYGSVL